MATHSSILALKVPWTEELGGLQSTGSQSQTRLKSLARMHTVSLFLSHCDLFLLKYAHQLGIYSLISLDMFIYCELGPNLFNCLKISTGNEFLQWLHAFLLLLFCY